MAGTLDVVKSSDTILTIGGKCSTSVPCSVRFGNTVYTFTSVATATLSAGSGTARIYIADDGALTVGHGSLTVICSNCTEQSGVTAFPADSVPLATWSATSGLWAETGADLRAFLAAKGVSPGVGLTSAELLGHTTLSVDGTAYPAATGNWDASGATTTKPMKTGTAPPATCTVGAYFYDSDAPAGQNTYACTATNTWTLQGDGGGGSGFDPFDVNTFWLRDEFFSGATGSAGNGSYGTLGWGRLQIGSNVGNIEPAIGVWPNATIIKVRTSATVVQNEGTVMYPVGLNVGTLGPLNAVTNWEARWIFRLSEITDPRARIGLCGDNNVNTAEPDNFIGIRFDTSAAYNDDVDGAGGRFWVVTRSNDVVTETETAVAANTAFHTIRIRSNVAGTIIFNVDGGSDISHSTNVTSDDIGPCLHITSARAGGARIDIDADFFAFKRTVAR